MQIKALPVPPPFDGWQHYTWPKREHGGEMPPVPNFVRLQEQPRPRRHYDFSRIARSLWGATGEDG